MGAWDPRDRDIEIEHVPGRGYLLRNKRTGEIKKVTGITSAIRKWFEDDYDDAPQSQLHRQRGIEFHSQISNYFQSGGLNRPPAAAQKVWDTLGSLELKFPRSQGWELQSEVPVTDFHKYATQIDLVAENKRTGETVLIDFKTGKFKRPQASAQLSLEKRMWEARNPGRRVTGLYVYQPGRDRPWNSVPENDHVQLDKIFYRGGPRSKALVKQDKLDLKKWKPGLGDKSFKRMLPLKSNLSNYGREITVFDIETGTGNQVLSIAGLKGRFNKLTGNFELIDTYERYYHPRDFGTKGDQLRLESIHGLSDKVIKRLRSLQGAKYGKYFTAAEQDAFKAFVGDSVLAGHNVAEFDIPNAVTAEFGKTGPLQLPRHGKWKPGVIDTLQLAEGFRGVGKDVNTLSTLYREVTGKPISNAHNALSDVYSNIKVLEGMLRDRGELGKAARVLTFSNRALSTMSANVINDQEVQRIVNKEGIPLTQDDIDNATQALGLGDGFSAVDLTDTGRTESDYPLGPGRAAASPGIDTAYLDNLIDIAGANKAAAGALSDRMYDLTEVTRAQLQAQLRRYLQSAASQNPTLVRKSLQGMGYAGTGLDNIMQMHQGLAWTHNERLIREKVIPAAVKYRDSALLTSARKALEAGGVSYEGMLAMKTGIDAARTQYQQEQLVSKAYAKANIKGYMYGVDSTGHQTNYLARMAQATDPETRFAAYQDYTLNTAREKKARTLERTGAPASIIAHMRDATTFEELDTASREARDWKSQRSFEERKERYAYSAELRGDDRAASVYRLAQSEEELWRVRQQEIVTNERAASLRSAMNQVRPYDFFRLADVSYGAAGDIFNSAKGVIPEWLRRPGERIFQGIAKPLMADVERAKGVTGAITQGVLPVVGGILGAFAGNPALGVLLGQGVGAGVTQIAGNLLEGGIKGKSLDIQSRFDMWAGLLDIGHTAFSPLIDIAKTLARALKTVAVTALAAGTALNLMMRSGLRQMTNLATPLTTMSGVTYADYQRTSFIDSLAHLGTGATNASIENISAMGNALYTTGSYDSGKLTAAAMLGVFGDIYKPGQMSAESYYDLVNKLAASVATSGNAAQTFAQIRTLDPTIAQTIQVMRDMGISDVRQMYSSRGMYWNPVTNDEAIRFRKAGYEYAVANEQWDVSKMRLSVRLWELVGKQAYDTANEVFDLMAQGQFAEAWNVLKERVSELWTSVTNGLGIDASSVGSFFGTLWEKVAEGLGTVMMKIKPVFEFLYDTFTDVILRIARGLWSVFGDFITRLSDIKIDFVKLIKGEPGAITSWSKEKLAKGDLSSASVASSPGHGLVHWNMDTMSEPYFMLNADPDTIRKKIKQDPNHWSWNGVALPTLTEADAEALSVLMGMNGDWQNWDHATTQMILGDPRFTKFFSPEELQMLQRRHQENDWVGKGLDGAEEYFGGARKEVFTAYDLAASALPGALKEAASVVVKIKNDAGKVISEVMATSDGRAAAKADSRWAAIESLDFNHAVSAANAGGMPQ